MAKVRQELEFDDGGLLAGLKAVREEAEKNAKAFDDLGKEQKESSKEAKKGFDDQNKALDSLNKEIAENIDVTKQSTKEASNWAETVKQSTRDVTIFGVNVGQTADKITKFGNTLRGSTSAITGSTKALRAFKIALASTGIGLIIVALGSLITYFTRTQRGVDQLNIALVKIRSVIDNVVDRISQVGEGFSKILSGDVRAGIDQIRTSFKGIGEETRKDVEAAGDLEKRQQGLVRLNQALTVEEAKRREQINKLREDSKKLGLTDQERIDKLKEAGKLEDGLAALRSVIAQEELDVIRAKNDLAESFNKDNQAAADAEAKLYNINSQRAQGQLQLLSEIGSLTQKVTAESLAAAATKQAQLDAEIKKVNELKAAYDEYITLVTGRIQAEKLASLSGIERIKEERRIAEEQLVELKNAAMTAAANAGVEFALESQFKILADNIVSAYDDAIKDLKKGRENDAAIFSLLPTKGEATANMDKYLDGLRLGLKKTKAEELIEAMHGIRAQILVGLNLTEEDAKQVADNIGQLFDTFGDAFAAQTDKKLEANKRLLDGIREQTATVEEELNRQLQLQETGRSNNVESKKKELEEIRKAEEKAMKEQQRLEQQRQRQQLAANLAQQTSNLITGGTALIAQIAKGGLVGLLAGGVAVAQLFTLFSTVKSLASNSVGQRAYKGGALGDYMRNSGVIKPGGRSDIPGRGDGYHILGTDVVVGGEEFLTNEQTSKRQARFMPILNSGALDNYNLYDFFKSPPPVEAFNKLTERRGRSIRRNTYERTERAMETAISSRLDRLIAVTQGKTEWYPLSMQEEGRIERDSAGNIRVIRK